MIGVIEINLTDDVMPDQTLTLESLLQADSELNSLPEIYIKISDLLDSENSSVGDIGKVVETDPALSSRILKMVNSAFYGFPNKISSISQSISILGRDRLKQVLIGSVLASVFGKESSKVDHMEDFWYQSVKTAILARYLGRQSIISDETESLFTAGLLHEIGRLILAQQLPELSAKVQSIIEIEGEKRLQAENGQFGFTHCEVGGAFIEKWGLPQLLSEVARYHHSPQQATTYNEETQLIYLASHLTFLIPPIQQEEVELVLEDISNWQSSGIPVLKITEACELAEEQVYEVMETLGMRQMKIEGDD